MNKYLLSIISKPDMSNINMADIEAYKIAVINEMIKCGASSAQLNLVKEGAIKYAIINKRKPEDLAWAIMQ